VNDFPEFVKNPANKIAAESQHTQDIDGYVFDGADGSQACFWKCFQGRASATHWHEYDEYMLVVQGEYTVIIGEDRFRLLPGQEFLIPKGMTHGGECVAGTRTIHVFGGQRAKRTREVNT
jgi:mannose-6-phosphate isomerase-like protein (cupin superfamily)